MSVRKCLLVGDGGTGKTSFITRLVTGEFTARYVATLGYEIHKIAVRTKDSTEFVLEVWDVSGQTSSGDFLSEILSGAHCAIIVFDVTSRITFSNVAIWYREILRSCGPNIPVAIVGNKIDMPARKMKIETMLRKFSSRIKYYNVSVKTKFNVNEPMLWIAAELLQISHNEDNSDALGIKLEAPPKSPVKEENKENSDTNLEHASTRSRMRKSGNGSAKVNVNQTKKKTK